VSSFKEGSAFIWVSLGPASYKKAASMPAGIGINSTAGADLNGDGAQDVAVVGASSPDLLIYLDKGDGSFFPPEGFGPPGPMPVFLIAAALDGDGHPDVVSAEATTLSIFWGRGGSPILESGLNLSGFASARTMDIADLDGDAFQDLFFPSSAVPSL